MSDLSEEAEKSKSLWWISLYNCLYFLVSDFCGIEKYRSRIFDPLDEFETEIYNGINTDSLKFFVVNGWISEGQKMELLRFKSFVLGISSSYWNETDFLRHQDWLIAKKWGAKLFDELGFEDRGWDFTGETVIYY